MTTTHRNRHIGAKRTIRRAMAYLRWICRSTDDAGARIPSRTSRTSDTARACPACYHVE